MTNLFGKFCYVLSTLHDFRHRHFGGKVISVPVDICRYFTGKYILYRRWKHNELLTRVKNQKWQWRSSA